nr:hypothetical protein CFP56_02128 [Quercus suber]
MRTPPVHDNTPCRGRDFPMAQSEVYGAPHEIPALPPLQRRSGAQVKQAASGSSRDEARHIRSLGGNNIFNAIT